MSPASASTAGSLDVNSSLSRPVYSVSQISYADFFISPLGATYMIAHNLRQFGKTERARNIWIFGILTLLLFLAATLMLPRDLRFLAFIVNFIFVKIAPAFSMKTQVRGVKDHIARGGKTYSGWNWLAVSVASVLIVIACLIPLVPVHHYFER